MTVKDFFNNLANMPKKEVAFPPCPPWRHCWGEWRYSPLILKLWISWRCVVCLMLWKLCPANRSWYPL